MSINTTYVYSRTEAYAFIRCLLEARAQFTTNHDGERWAISYPATFTPRLDEFAGMRGVAA